MSESNGVVTRIEDLAPAFTVLTLKGLNIRVRCEAMNAIELLRRQQALPGLPPPMTDDERAELTEAAQDPARIERAVYPLIVAGCFMLDAQGEPIRPTFSIEEEPGRISLRRVPDGDVLAMFNATNEASRWGGAVEALDFPDDSGGRTNSTGAVGAGQG